MAEVKNQVKGAIDNVAERAKNATDWVADKAESARESAGEMIGAVQDRAAGAARSVADTAIRTKEKVGEWVGDVATPAAEFCSEAAAETKQAVRRASNDLTDVIKAHPLTAIAIGFGVGLLVGRSIHRA